MAPVLLFTAGWSVRAWAWNHSLCLASSRRCPSGTHSLRCVRGHILVHRRRPSSCPHVFSWRGWLLVSLCPGSTVSISDAISAPSVSPLIKSVRGISTYCCLFPEETEDVFNETQRIMHLQVHLLPRGWTKVPSVQALGLSRAWPLVSPELSAGVHGLPRALQSRALSHGQEHIPNGLGETQIIVQTASPQGVLRVLCVFPAGPRLSL